MHNLYSPETIYNRTGEQASDHFPAMLTLHFNLNYGDL